MGARAGELTIGCWRALEAVLRSRRMGNSATAGSGSQEAMGKVECRLADSWSRR